MNHLNFKGYRYSASIIVTAIRWYFRYKLLLEDVTELLMERGIEVSRQTILDWSTKLGPKLASLLNIQRRKPGRRFNIDETYIKVAGKMVYLYRAVDENMNVIDVYVSSYRNKKAAQRFLKKAVIAAGHEPDSFRSDKHASYNQIKDLYPNSRHHRKKFLNNPAESSHVPVKQRYRPMRGFKNIQNLSKFMDSFEAVYHYFQIQRPKDNYVRRGEYMVSLDSFNQLIKANSVNF